MTEDQTAVIDCLASPATHAGAAVERVDTHSAIVFLAGGRAWKLKRAVRFDYLDFSTAERRRQCCEAEVQLNRRTAPTVYLGTVAVTRGSDGALALGGSGTPVDWVVEMTRFDQDALFDRLAARDRLDLALMAPLAGAIARFHRAAERRPDHGGSLGMTWVVDGNAAGFAEFGADILAPAACARLTEAARLEVGRQGAVLDARRATGFVRRCHGDLHLRNIVLLAGQPTLFDALEFNDALACNDVLYDLAFLLMDLWHRRLYRHANVVWNGYLAETADLDGIALAPLFLSCRAAVRAKTSVTSAALQTDPARRGELRALAREYLSMAEALLRPPSPCLVAVGGLSGSGKSTLALALAPSVGAVPGALVLRSDEVRKRLCGVGALDRLGPEGYTPDVSSRVDATLAEQASRVVHAGHSAIVDAVYAEPADRQAIERVAVGASIPFVGIWLDAPEHSLLARVNRRQLDPSDATAGVVRTQLARDTGAIAWHRIDAPTQVALDRALEHIQAGAPGPAAGASAAWSLDRGALI
jgi:aminoglycoside phosphotransferase family enzyme